MALSHRRLIAALAFVALCAPAIAAVVPASADADSPSPTIIAVPSGDRSYAREAQVYGETNYGLVYREEVDPADYNGYREQLELLAPDGTESTIPGPTGGDAEATVFGDLLVDADNSGTRLASVYTLTLPAVTWVLTTVPSTGVSYVGVSDPGIVLNTSSGLAIQPWGTSTPVAISTGLSDLTATTVLAADEHGIVLEASYQVGGSTVKGDVYLDTDTETAWPLGVDTSYIALSATNILWTSDLATISSVSRPQAGDALGSVQTRSVSDADQGVSWDHFLAVGSDAIIETDAHNGAYSVDSTAPDGTVVALGDEFSSITGDGSDLLGVEGLDPDNETIQQIDPSDGSGSNLVTIPPVAAQAGEVGIDGDTLEVIGGAGVTRRDLDFGTQTASAPTLLAASGSNPFVADGSTYWTNSGGYREVEADGGSAQVTNDANGTLELDDVGANWWMENPRAEGDSNMWLVNASTGDGRSAGFGTAMVDDVLYTPAANVSGLLRNGVVAQDLDTGREQYIPVAGCDRAAAVQANQSWLLVSCDNGTYVLDQSGTTAEWKLGSGWGVLGNGFLVSVATSGEISWTSLAGPTANWQTIGSIGSYAEAVNLQGALAVSTTGAPTIAWIDATGAVWAAQLPDTVETSLPAHPAGGPTAVPATPSLSPVSADGSLTLDWAAPASSDQVVNFDLTIDGGTPIILPASDSSYTVTGLKDGYEDTYSLTARNVVGQSAAAQVTAAAWNPNPSAPSNLIAVFNPQLSTLTLNWDWAGQIGTSELTGFSVSVPGSAAVPISAGARSTTVDDVSAPVGTTITLTATSADGSASTTAQTVAPGSLSTQTPQLTGTPTVGETLTAVPGTWGPGTVDLSYQWESGGDLIIGADSSTYVLTPADAGKTISVVVTGSEVGYLLAFEYSAVELVAPAALTTTLPTISGIPNVGDSLSVDSGGWGPIGVRLSYQWFRSGAPIAKATGATYKLTSADAGTTITVSVTGSLEGYATSSRRSAGFAVNRVFGTATTPAISGPQAVGARLTVVTGRWSPSPTFTYQWNVNGVPIAGATARSFVVSTIDSGKSVTVTVTATKSGYTSLIRTSRVSTIPFTHRGTFQDPDLWLTVR